MINIFAKINFLTLQVPFDLMFPIASVYGTKIILLDLYNIKIIVTTL